MKTIKELVLSAKNGNKKAFDKLYKLTSNDVWFTCVSLLKDEENAKDIAADRITGPAAMSLCLNRMPYHRKD